MIFLARASETGPLRSTRNVSNASSNTRTKTFISSGPNEAFCKKRVIGIVPPKQKLILNWIRCRRSDPQTEGLQFWDDDDEPELSADEGPLRLGFLGISLGGWIGYLIAGFIGACILIAIARAFSGGLQRT
jgi:hypothetical protein